jgi:anaerobic dimethyl sulfoxide reductase subunit B (iron-sulfur subunit)
MTQRGFYIETDRCVACHSCEVACKQWNNLGPSEVGKTGPRWRRVTEAVSGTYPTITVVNMSTSCNHCGKPACAAVCPTGAITKRAEDGIVLVDAAKCIGCKACAATCPFGAPQFAEDGKMQKCNFCLDRLAQGKAPACVATCPSRALHAGTMEELYQLASQKIVQTLTVATQPSLLISK